MAWQEVINGIDLPSKITIVRLQGDPKVLSVNVPSFKNVFPDDGNIILDFTTFKLSHQEPGLCGLTYDHFRR